MQMKMMLAPRTLKLRYRLALIACAVLAALSIILMVVMWRRSGTNAAQLDSEDLSLSLPRMTCTSAVCEPARPSPPERSKQANWDYKPSDNPRYEQNTQIQQIGFLTSATSPTSPGSPASPESTGSTGNAKILPLFGYSLREKHSDRWVYFTATDQHQSIRLPVESEGRDCMNDDIGCREVFTGDEIKVSALGDQPFTLTLYKNQFP